MKLKWFRSSPNASIPIYANPGDAGFDFRSAEDVAWICHNDVTVISTGLKVEIPEGYEIQVRPRSGMAAQFGIMVVNAPGTIDSGYRGEIKVILTKVLPGQHKIVMGDKIAQGVLCKVEKADMYVIDNEEELSDTKRGTGGLGSTGVK